MGRLKFKTQVHYHSFTNKDSNLSNLPLVSYNYLLKNSRHTLSITIFLLLEDIFPFPLRSNTFLHFVLPYDKKKKVRSRDNCQTILYVYFMTRVELHQSWPIQATKYVTQEFFFF